MLLLFLSYEQFKSWKIRLTFSQQGPAEIFAPWSDAETVTRTSQMGFSFGPFF